MGLALRVEVGLASIVHELPSLYREDYGCETATTARTAALLIRQESAGRLSQAPTFL